MRKMLVIVLMLALAGSAMAANLSTKPAVKPAGGIYNGGDGRQGGDTIASATVIGSLPFSDTGSTAGYANNYDEVCPYTGSTAPDVVYSYYASAAAAITIDLCASSYDTKVYVYQDAQGNVIACSDDASCGYSGYQSKVEGVALSAGHTYYIVVDGYGSSNGAYDMQVAGFEPCVVDCPAGALIEGEPTCQDNYVDNYDGGCNGSGWIEIQAQNGTTCGTLCGKSCTYLYNGLSYRDTDWYAALSLGGSVNATVTAAFPVQFIFIYGPDCNALQYNYVQAGACSPASLSYNIAAGGEFWLWVGASVFTGVPESNYVLEACNIVGGGVPTVTTSWGALKNEYK